MDFILLIVCATKVVLLCYGNLKRVDLISSSTRYNDTEVEVDFIGTWRLIGFYGDPNRSRRAFSWQLLKTLTSHSDILSCVPADIDVFVVAKNYFYKLLLLHDLYWK